LFISFDLRYEPDRQNRAGVAQPAPESPAWLLAGWAQSPSRQQGTGFAPAQGWDDPQRV